MDTVARGNLRCGLEFWRRRGGCHIFIEPHYRQSEVGGSGGVLRDSSVMLLVPFLRVLLNAERRRSGTRLGVIRVTQDVLVAMLLYG